MRPRRRSALLATYVNSRALDADAALNPGHLATSSCILVHLYCYEGCVQSVASGKSNEIVAIPALLDMLSIEGALVTIDAMGCQRE